MISHWFTPDEKSSIQPERLSKASLWHEVSFIHDDEYTLSSGDLLLISFDRSCSRRIKKNLYQFNVLPKEALRVVDCGTLNQKKPEVFLPALKEITNSGAIVVFIAAPVSFMRYQVAGSRMASIVKESNLDDDIHLRSDPPYPLLQYIGTQRHLISETHHSIEGHLRLSDLHADVSLAEPCIRDSDVMVFHCDSLNAAEAGYMTGMSSSGLTVMESCQLFRYAGAAESLSSVGVYGYSKDADVSGVTANAIAQMIWYLLEGSILREDPEQGVMTQYMVQSKDGEHTLVFYKSETSGRWWIVNKAGRKVPCSYHDYHKACEEDYSPLVIKSVLG